MQRYRVQTQREYPDKGCLLCESSPSSAITTWSFSTWGSTASLRRPIHRDAVTVSLNRKPGSTRTPVRLSPSSLTLTNRLREKDRAGERMKVKEIIIKGGEGTKYLTSTKCPVQNTLVNKIVKKQRQKFQLPTDLEGKWAFVNRGLHIIQPYHCANWRCNRAKVCFKKPRPRDARARP